MANGSTEHPGDLTRRAVDRLRARRRVARGVSAAEVAATEGRLGLRVPADLLAIDAQVDGDDEWQDMLDLSWWPMASWERATLRFGAVEVDGFLFADVLIRAPDFLIEADPVGGPSKVRVVFHTAEGEVDAQVSLDTFLRTWLDATDEIELLQAF